MKLGVLDQMAQPKGMTAEETAARTMEMAQYVEELGYERYWFAEHHATKGLASSSPEIMMAAVAAKTVKLKVGSGGILLPQYSAYKIATQLSQLQALFPGRIEAGVGRSPGGNETIRSLLADGKQDQLADYPDKLRDLITFLSKEGKVRAAPRTEDAPNLFSLGLGENSAKLAAELGIGYVYGHFIKPNRGKEAHQTYRAHFRPGYLDHPDTRSAIFVICGETDEQAEELAISQDVWLLNVEKGLDSRVPSIEEAKAKIWRVKEIEQIRENRKRMIIGGPGKVKNELLHLSERYQCNDWLILTNIYDFHEKQQSYRRIMELFS
ncbi:MAG: LLM class flavin-dependent oxidoreductase [Firmicutes bacterium]|uniref:Luciferase family oxidoreductase, group 1 n=2 Tax=Melghirimyces thermohalophilus TaxID=1236220 RepID=A0A1G6QMU2_9BACL|nr:LLM class flavin-dependent oxidoreductase [Melghirimyces thermohalophilus]MDA8353970.1 LLM class flavin-dependent oxidoreductase [Bacillota bacterium]SDC93056.1 luciferase family oxidoreductase, group 1 [Melghirimyces thermohalophilus]